MYAEKARDCFEGFLAGMGYAFSGTKEAGTKVTVYFRHRDMPLVLALENDWYPPDYGFAIYLYHTGFHQQNILYNIPPAQQDAACMFVAEAADRISSDALLKGLLTGRIWLRLNCIFFQD